MDINSSGTLKEIESLLNLLEGVTVIEASETKDSLHILLTIESHKSHLLLVYCAEAANVKFNCYTRYKPGSDEANSNPSKALIYSYHANNRKEESEEALDQFNWLGAFLVWTMYKTDIISSDYEKELAKKFNAVSRSSQFNAARRVK